MKASFPRFAAALLNSQLQPRHSRRMKDSWTAHELNLLPPYLRPRENETLELILKEKIFLLQARRGFRASLDSHILALFASNVFKDKKSSQPRPRVLDLGAGSGLVSILFSRIHRPLSLHLIEIQNALCDRACRNLALNHIAGHVHRHDLAQGILKPSLHRAFDVVLINPPFYQSQQRNRSPNQERQLAMVESTASFGDFIKAARSACDPHNENAFIALVQDVTQGQRCKEAFDANALHVTHVRHVCHSATSNPTRILFQLQLQPGAHRHPAEDDSTFTITHQQPKILHPLVLYQNSNHLNIYTPEIDQFFTSLPTPHWNIGHYSNKELEEFERFRSQVKQA